MCPKDYTLEDYSVPSWLAELSEGLRQDVMAFVHNGELSPLLEKALQQSTELRNHIDRLMDKELEKYGKAEAQNQDS